MKINQILVCQINCSESIIGEEELLLGKQSGSMVWVGSIMLIVPEAS